MNNNPLAVVCAALSHHKKVAHISLFGPDPDRVLIVLRNNWEVMVDYVAARGDQPGGYQLIVENRTDGYPWRVLMNSWAIYDRLLDPAELVDAFNTVIDEAKSNPLEEGDGHPLDSTGKPVLPVRAWVRRLRRAWRSRNGGAR